MRSLLAVAALMGLSACGFKVVDTGHRGVETHFGQVENVSLDEGLHFYNPFTSDIIQMDVRTHKSNIKTFTYTKDVQQAELTGSINYNLEKTKAHIVYQEVGVNWDDILVGQVVEGAIKNTIGKWDAVDLVANRDKATLAIQAAIQQGLKGRGVTISHFEITNIDFADAFENAVEAKVVAIQQAQEAENKTKRIEEEARQKVISAKAEAESMKIRSEALAQNKGLVEYEAVKKWSGEMPQTLIVGSESQIPFIQIPTK